MSALLEAVNAVAQAQKGPRCTVARLLDDLPADYRADLLDLMATGDIPSTMIADGLAKLALDESQPGWEISHGTLQRHRKGRCLCGRAR